MLQPAGDLGLEQEPRPADGVVGVLVLDLLEGDLAVQLVVVGDEDLPRPPLAWGRRMRNRWPSRGGRADGVGGGAVGVVVGPAAPAPTWARVASMSGSAIRARLSRIERPS